MIMKKTLISLCLLLTFLLTFGLTSCMEITPSGEENTETNTEASGNGGMTKIDFGELESGNYITVVHDEDETVRGKEENDEALRAEYADVTPEECVGRFRGVLSPMPTIKLYEDGTFFFHSPLSSFKTAITGTYTVEGNQLLLQANADYTDTVYTLSFSFLNADTLVFHPDKSSDLYEFLIYYKEDVAFLRTDE